MQHIERSDLVLGELVRALEIIGFHLFLRFIRLDIVCSNTSVRKRRKQFIYLRLR